jgi:hypothetical protein
LDWLATELISGDWKIKRIHKLIMMSSTYRQASIHPRQAEYTDRDSGNRLWWRSSRRRLDAESLRDAMLTVSGNLNLKKGGPSFFPEMSAEALEGLSRKASAWKASSAEERARRSIYMMSKRALLLPLMTVFDFSDTMQPCGARNVTTVAPQALALLNNRFVHEQSEEMARRIVADVGSDLSRQVRRVWQLALSRSPSDQEIVVALDHLNSQRTYFDSKVSSRKNSRRLALASLCHVLLNTNEFMYID